MFNRIVRIDNMYGMQSAVYAYNQQPGLTLLYPYLSN